MDPTFQFTSPDYQTSNKLQVLIKILFCIVSGNSGIGRVVCNLFALEGATVAFTSVKGQEDKDVKDMHEICHRIYSKERR
ncbi:hypothetical protein AHAS_Ahas03G0105600 [Arachis hypogaea]